MVQILVKEIDEYDVEIIMGRSKKQNYKNKKIRETEEVDGVEEMKEQEKILALPGLGTILKCLIFLLVPVLLFYLMEAYEHNAFEEVRTMAQLLNIILFELIAWLLFFITGKGKWALRILTGLAMVYGLINHYVMAFRSTPFVPWDIFSIKTAASVAGNYDFTPTKEVVIVTIIFVAILVLLRFFKFEFPYGVGLRVIPVVCIGIVLSLFVNLLQDEDFQSDAYLYPFLFTPAYMTKVNGMAVTFAMDLAYVYVEKPAGYSVKEAEEILAAYTNEEVIDEELPNIIVIMNEAFSDLSVLGDFTTNEDYMPYIHSLQEGNENTITGNLTVSVVGGNTANSEFEFLTGHTMDFFPMGSIPYQQYIKDELPSLASQLKNLGYATYGMHPYNASGWKRDEVYPWIGFDTSYFVKDFVGRSYIRNYVSDASAYDKIIETYENKEDGTPLFVFEVTMQNHGGYTDEHENFAPDIHVQEKDDIVLARYLSLIKESDKQLEHLISYFSEQEEDTVIVFFGDHQPSDYVANKVYSVSGKTSISEADAQNRYIVPYVIWANYDIREGVKEDTDISYLAAKVLKEAGLSTNAYQNFLLELEEILADDSTPQETKDKYKDIHQKLQYYYMFDYEKEES